MASHDSGVGVPWRTVTDSEFAFIERVRDVLGTRNAGVTVGIGDDAAVLGGGVCVTCDLLVEDVHFRRSTTPLA